MKINSNFLSILGGQALSANQRRILHVYTPQEVLILL